jgi:DNA-binding transcriptional ArsR family regulator
MNFPLMKPEIRRAEDAAAMMEQARKASDLLKALSHEHRLLILCILSEGERSVSELEEILCLPQAAVSQQLARLRLDHLVKTRRDGRMIYYSISDTEVSSIVHSLYEIFCRDVRKGA